MNDSSKQKASELLKNIRNISSQSKTRLIEKNETIRKNIKEKWAVFKDSAFVHGIKSGATVVMDSVKKTTFAAAASISIGFKRRREITEAKRQFEEKKSNQSLDERQAILEKLLHCADVALEKNNSECFSKTMDSINILLTNPIK